MRRARRRPVQVRRDPDLAPDARRRAMGERHRVVQRRIAERHERQNVERSDPRVRAAMHPQIDAPTRDVRERDGRRDDLRRSPTAVITLR